MYRCVIMLVSLAVYILWRINVKINNWERKENLSLMCYYPAFEFNEYLCSWTASIIAWVTFEDVAIVFAYVIWLFKNIVASVRVYVLVYLAPHTVLDLFPEDVLICPSVPSSYLIPMLVLDTIEMSLHHILFQVGYALWTFTSWVLITLLVDVMSISRSHGQVVVHLSLTHLFVCHANYFFHLLNVSRPCKAFPS